MSTTRTALARLYRPRRFAEVATQEHVSETLKAAVARNRVAHAYLFCGPRGVGKTTAARILAMALNCPNRAEDGEPCGVCENCERIWSGKTSLDVVEIDAASNRGVDDARDLRERAMYAPTDEKRFKVYIIDEAHMLTREAWNALLKILEEPPPRVIFVFATTEPQKIQQAAPPILSRCQRFDFRRIGARDIVARLLTVLHEEGIEATEDALIPIARRAEGGMRDALSLLDQVLALADRVVTADDVVRVLGLVGEELYLDLFDILADHRHADVFRFVERLLDEGYDLAEFHRGLADAIRRVMVAKLDGIEAIDAREDLLDRYADVAERFAIGDLLRMLAQVGELDTEGKLRKSGNPRLLVEVMLLRFAHIGRMVELEDLLRGGTLPDDAPAPPRPPRQGTGGSAPGRAAATREKPSGGAPGGTSGRDALRAAIGGAPGAAPGAVPTPAPSATSTPTPAQPAQPAPRVAERADRPEPRPSDEPAAASESAAPAAATEQAAPAAVEGAEPQPADAAPHPVEAAPSEPAPRAPQGPTVQVAFRTLLETPAQLPSGLGFFLRAARVSEPAPGEVVLEVPPGPGLEKLSHDGVAQRAIRDALTERLGRRVEVAVRPLSGGGAKEAAPARLTPEKVRGEKLERMAKEAPTLGEAMRTWDLELLD